MNSELHHKWNAERDSQRGSNQKGPQISEEEKKENKITLRHSKQR